MSKDQITRVSDVMTKSVITIEPTAKVAEAVGLMRENRTSSIIVQRRDADDTPPPDFVQKYGRTVRGHYLDQARARYRTAAASERTHRTRVTARESGTPGIPGASAPGRAARTPATP